MFEQITKSFIEEQKKCAFFEIFRGSEEDIDTTNSYHKDNNTSVSQNNSSTAQSQQQLQNQRMSFSEQNCSEEEGNNNVKQIPQKKPLSVKAQRSQSYRDRLKEEDKILSQENEDMHDQFQEIQFEVQDSQLQQQLKDCLELYQDYINQFINIVKPVQKRIQKKNKQISAEEEKQYKQKLAQLNRESAKRSRDRQKEKKNQMLRINEKYKNLKYKLIQYNPQFKSIFCGKNGEGCQELNTNQVKQEPPIFIYGYNMNNIQDLKQEPTKFSQNAAYNFNMEINAMNNAASTIYKNNNTNNSNFNHENNFNNIPKLQSVRQNYSDTTQNSINQESPNNSTCFNNNNTQQQNNEQHEYLNNQDVCQYDEFGQQQQQQCDFDFNKEDFQKCTNEKQEFDCDIFEEYNSQQNSQKQQQEEQLNLDQDFNSNNCDQLQEGNFLEDSQYEQQQQQQENKNINNTNINSNGRSNINSNRYMQGVFMFTMCIVGIIAFIDTSVSQYSHVLLQQFKPGNNVVNRYEFKSDLYEQRKLATDKLLFIMQEEGCEDIPSKQMVLENPEKHKICYQHILRVSESLILAGQDDIFVKYSQLSTQFEKDGQYDPHIHNDIKAFKLHPDQMLSQTYLLIYDFKRSFETVKQEIEQNIDDPKTIQQDMLYQFTFMMTQCENDECKKENIQNLQDYIDMYEVIESKDIYYYMSKMLLAKAYIIVFPEGIKESGVNLREYLEESKREIIRQGLKKSFYYTECSKVIAELNFLEKNYVDAIKIINEVFWIENQVICPKSLSARNTNRLMKKYWYWRIQDEEVVSHLDEGLMRKLEKYSGKEGIYVSDEEMEADDSEFINLKEACMGFYKQVY